MKSKIVFMACFFALWSNAQSIGINGNGANPDPSAALDVSSNNKGVLVPRVSLTASNLATPITAPTSSLLVYNTATAGVFPNNVTPGYYFWNGTKWQSLLSASSGWATTGNAGLNAANNFIGTTDAVDFIFKTNNSERARITSSGNFGIGTASSWAPSKLTVFDVSSWSSSVLTLGNNAGWYEFIISNGFNNSTFGSGAANYSGSGYQNVMVVNLGGSGHIVFGDNVGPWADANYDMGASFARWRYLFTSNGVVYSSDARLKSNVQVIPYGIETVMKLNPVIYEKYTDFEKKGEFKIETGFIAQELRELVPNSVVDDTLDETPMGVVYEQIIPVLTKAIQDQQLIIEKLENRIVILEGKLEE